MKILTVFTLFFVLCLAVSASDKFDALKINSNKPTKEIFKYFHFVHSKEYSLNSEEALNRYRIFKKNLEWSKEENRKLGKTIYGITQFSDMTHEEFLEKQILKPEQFQSELQEIQKGSTRFLAQDDHPNLQDEEDFRKYYHEVSSTSSLEIDWRHLMVPPKNQRSCGSCWSFSAIAVMEAGYNQMKANGQLKTFSEQYLINCDHLDNGCNGGWPTNTLKWVRDHGVIDADLLPYENRQNSCDNSLENNSHKILNKYMFYNGQPSQYLNWASGLKMRPMIVGMDAGFQGFMQYRPDNFDPIVPPSCNGLNHAVVAVGFTNENGQDYIMVRNSWGTGWGYQGYFKIPANNCCGITTYGWIPDIIDA